MTTDEKITLLEQEIALNQKQSKAYGLAQRAIFVQLFHKLTEKNILSDNEAKKLLQDAATSFVKPLATDMEAMAFGLIQAIIDIL